MKMAKLGLGLRSHGRGSYSTINGSSVPPGNRYIEQLNEYNHKQELEEEEAEYAIHSTKNRINRRRAPLYYKEKQVMT